MNLLLDGVLPQCLVADLLTGPHVSTYLEALKSQTDEDMH
jgi:hypothetical protein